MRRTALAVWVCLLTIPVGAEPIAQGPETALVAGTLSENARKTLAARSFQVRTDPETGRLVRVAVRTKAEQPKAPTQSGTASTRKTVVQGSSVRSENSSGRLDIDFLVRQAGQRYQVDPELIHAVIRQESGYDPFAVSRKGALGLMQLMPATAEQLGVKDILDPAENVHGGVKYLRRLLDRYEGDPRLALAAYNAGEGAVDRYGDVPPYRETVDYVARISASYGIQSNVASGGESDTDAETARSSIVEVIAEDGSIRFESATN